MKKSIVPALLSTALLLLAVVALGQDSKVAATEKSAWIKFNPVTPLTAASFAGPPLADHPWVRMNIPATADPSEIAAEVREMGRNGIAGVEIGQGAFPNNDQLAALYTTANQLGIKVSLSHGPTQNLPGYSIDSDNARKTLVFGKAAVGAGATFEGPVPAGTLTVVGRGGFGGAGGRGPAGGRAGAGAAGGRAGAAAAGGGRGGAQPARTTLIALLAYRCTQTPCPATGPAELDRASAVDLTSAVTGRNTAGVLGGTTSGSILWTAPSSPAGAQWQVIAFWTRGAFAQPDPFSEEGCQELLNNLETNLSPRIKELMKANGGDLFYDSHSSDRGSPDELWTNKMAEEFAKRRQYPLIPNLPALFREYFEFNDGSAPRVRDDFYAVRGDIWIEKQIQPLRAWVRKHNNLLRVQVEGEANMIIPITDMVLAAAAVDRPEHEDLFVGDEVDNYLPIASANHMTGNPWYSTECCAVFGKSYAQTFQDAVIHMHKSFVGGITKLVYHVYPYRDGDTWKWPGYHNFGPTGFSNAWGPRNPYWVDGRLYNDFFARNQQVLTQGDAKTDVAVYMQNYLYPPSQVIKTRHWGDLKLQEAGYTRLPQPDHARPPHRHRYGKASRGQRALVPGPDRRQ